MIEPVAKMRENFNIGAGEALLALQSDGAARLVDVRSEGEFARASIPGSFNLAILNNEQRHLVGCAYKQQGSERALELGHNLVDPLKENLVAGWRELLKNSPPELRFISCL